MTRIPSVADGLLRGTAAAGADGLVVGSPAWFASLTVTQADDGTTERPAHSPTRRRSSGSWPGSATWARRVYCWSSTRRPTRGNPTTWRDHP